MPAYLLLPLWAVMQFVLALDGERGITSSWAQLGGFLFGALVASLLKATGLEARLEARLEEARALAPSEPAPRRPKR